jgi:hypothetical protein
MLVARVRDRAAEGATEPGPAIPGMEPARVPVEMG